MKTRFDQVKCKIRNTLRTNDKPQKINKQYFQRLALLEYYLIVTYHISRDSFLKNFVYIKEEVYIIFQLLAGKLYFIKARTLF